jgi:hypothetical protein
VFRLPEQKWIKSWQTVHPSPCCFLQCSVALSRDNAVEHNIILSKINSRTGNENPREENAGMKTWERKMQAWLFERLRETNSGGQASCPTSSAREASAPHQRKVAVFEWYTRNELCQLNLSIKAYKLVQSSIGAVTDDLQSKNKNNASLSSSHPEWSNWSGWSMYSWSNGEEMM